MYSTRDYTHVVSKVKDHEPVDCETLIGLYSFCNDAFVWEGLPRRSLILLALCKANIKRHGIDHRKCFYMTLLCKCAM